MPGPSQRRKEPPYSVLAEKSVVAALLAAPDLAGELTELLPDPAMFFRPEYGRAYAHLAFGDAASSSPATGAPRGGGRRIATDADRAELIVVMAGSEVRAAPGRPERPRPDLLADLEGLNVTPEAARAAARTVAEKARMRRLVETLSECLFEASHSAEGFERLYADAMERLRKLDSA